MIRQKRCEDGEQLEIERQKFSNMMNSVLQQPAVPAEELGTHAKDTASGAHSLYNSVASTPSFVAGNFDEKAFHLTQDQIKCPVVIEVFCGSARLTASLKVLGMTSSFGVDHSTSKAVSTAKDLDLTRYDHQQILFMWMSSPLVMGIFLAPPCGTCSLARNIQLRDSRGKPMLGPRPLRSPDCPEGLPNLTEHERLRVSSANKLYELVAKIVSFAHDRKLVVVVENPRSSLFWRTKYWQSVAKTMGYTAHQACAFGGSRPKWTVLAWSHPVFAKLCMTCPGESADHVHQPWGLVQTSEGRHFSTSEEAAYPKPLALAIARCFAEVCIQNGWSPPLEQLEHDLEPNSKFMRAVATAQPKAAQMPPIVREHKQVILIRGPHDLLQQAPAQVMQRLKDPWPLPNGCSAPISALPAGAQFLRVTPLRSNGGILQEASGSTSANQAEQAWGIPFSPEEFIHEAVQRGHPKAFSKLVPKFLKDAIMDNFGLNLSLGEIASERVRWFARWTKRAKELSQEEASFKADLPEHVRKILCPKRLLLWKEILQELGYGDMEVFEEISNGTQLVGEVPTCGVFEKKFKVQI